MTITLNKKLDAKQLAKTFKETGRLQIHDFLDPKAAEEIYTALTVNTPWQITYNQGKKANWINLKDLEAKIGRRLREMTETIFNAAAKGEFQYVRYGRLLKENQTGMLPLDQVLVDTYDFFNSKEMNGFIKAVTGAAVKEADAEAHWYQNDNFQSKGDGLEAGGKPLVGFCLNMARDWLPDWGGTTFFYDQDGGVEEVFVPRFNSLELFALPASHSITLVAPFASKFRVSISGTFS